MNASSRENKNNTHRIRQESLKFFSSPVVKNFRKTVRYFPILYIYICIYVRGIYNISNFGDIHRQQQHRPNSLSETKNSGTNGSPDKRKLEAVLRTICARNGSGIYIGEFQIRISIYRVCRVTVIWYDIIFHFFPKLLLHQNWRNWSI